MRDAMSERGALVALLSLPDARWGEVAHQVLESGSAVESLAKQLDDPDALFPHGDADELVVQATRQVADWEASGITVSTFFDDDYPAQLRDIREMPPLVFTKGSLTPDPRAVAVVGSRCASPAGLNRASKIAKTLTQQGVTVVSGLAAGIDSAAHRATLDAGGRTVAVIGTGINRQYPADNSELQDQIAANGLVLSQFWPDTPPTKQTFPMRNIVMSGYAATTVVVEASQISGTRIQARRALEHGRTVILPTDVLTTDWARNLAEQPGVIVVDSYGELEAAVEEVFDSLTIDLSSLGPVSVTS